MSRPFHGLTGSAAGHQSIAPRFKPRLAYVGRMFHLSIRLITFGGHSAHLAYPVQKGDRETAASVLMSILLRHLTTGTERV